jgi:hypothetical protein
MKAGHALTELGFKIQREHFGEFLGHSRASVWRNAAITDRKPFTVSTTTLAMRSASSYESVGFFCMKGLYERFSQSFSGRGATRNLDTKIACPLAVRMAGFHPEVTRNADPFL